MACPNPTSRLACSSSECGFAELESCMNSINQIPAAALRLRDYRSRPFQLQRQRFPYPLTCAPHGYSQSLNVAAHMKSTHDVIPLQSQSLHHTTDLALLLPPARHLLFQLDFLKFLHDNPARLAPSNILPHDALRHQPHNHHAHESDVTCPAANTTYHHNLTLAQPPLDRESRVNQSVMIRQ